MAKKTDQTYQIVIRNAEDKPFIKRLLEIYGYQEDEPGVFSESPKPKAKPRTARQSSSQPKPKTIAKPKSTAKETEKRTLITKNKTTKTPPATAKRTRTTKPKSK